MFIGQLAFQDIRFFRGGEAGDNYCFSGMRIAGLLWLYICSMKATEQLPG